MPEFEKDIETLREAYQQLSSNVLRFGVIRLSILFIMIVSFSRAFEQIDSREVKKKQEEIQNLEQGLFAKNRDTQDLKKELDDKRREFNRLWAANSNWSGKPKQEPPHSGPPLNASRGKKEKPRQAAIPVTSPSREEINTAEAEKKKVEDEFTRAEADRKSDQGKIEDLKSGIADIYRKAFRVKVPVPGTEPEIDLRTWIYSLPFLFMFSEVYLFTLRKQRRLLSMVAAYRIRERSRNDTSTFDHLLFASDPANAPPFAQHPSQMLTNLYVLCTLALAVYLVVVAQPFWGNWDATALIPVSQILLTAAFYTLAYCLYVSSTLDAQVASATGLIPRPSRLLTIWKRGIGWIWSKLSLLKPTVSVSTGSLLILMTLFLATSVDSCFGGHRGYDLVRGWAEESTRNKADEFFEADPREYLQDEETTEEPFKKRKVYWLGMFGFSNYGNYVGRSLYILGLVLAILAFFGLLIARTSSASYQNQRWRLWLYGVAGTLSLYVLSAYYFLLLSLSFPDSTSAHYSLLALWLLYWLIPVALWFRFAFSRRNETRARWPAVRSVLIVLYAPVAIFTCLFLVLAMVGGLNGLLAYVVGVNLLWLGYMQLAGGSATPVKPLG